MDLVAFVFIFIGIGLLIAEIFVPSFGITGGLGIVSIIIGVILTAENLADGIILFIIILVVSIILMIITYKVLASKRSPLVLKEASRQEPSNEKLLSYVGREGKALTPLRPAGTAEVMGERIDVITEGEFIEKDQVIVVKEIRGKKVIVKELLQ